jgi:hypothetical protein
MPGAVEKSAIQCGKSISTVRLWKVTPSHLSVRRGWSGLIVSSYSTFSKRQAAIKTGVKENLDTHQTFSNLYARSLPRLIFISLCWPGHVPKQG